MLCATGEPSHSAVMYHRSPMGRWHYGNDFYAKPLKLGRRGCSNGIKKFGKPMPPLESMPKINKTGMNLLLLILFLPCLSRMTIFRPDEISLTLTLGIRQILEITAVILQALTIVSLVIGKSVRPTKSNWAFILFAISVVLAVFISKPSSFSALRILEIVSSVGIFHLLISSRYFGLLRGMLKILTFWVCVYLVDSALNSIFFPKAQISYIWKSNYHSMAIAGIGLYYVCKSKNIANAVGVSILAFLVALFIPQSLGTVVAFLLAALCVLVGRLGINRAHGWNSTIFVFVFAAVFGMFYIVFSEVVFRALAEISGRSVDAINSGSGRRYIWQHVLNLWTRDIESFVFGLGFSTAERVQLINYFAMLTKKYILAGGDTRHAIQVHGHAHNFILSCGLNGGIIWVTVNLVAIIIPFFTFAKEIRNREQLFLLGCLLVFVVNGISDPMYANVFGFSYIFIGAPLHYALSIWRPAR